MRFDFKGGSEMKGLVLWMTGLSGAGKTTVARALKDKVVALGHKAAILDGDELRKHLSDDLGYTSKDRAFHAKRVAFTAKLLADNDILTIVAVMAPSKDVRESCRQVIGDKFKEVFVNAKLETCEERDVKGLYKRARSGEIKDFIGIDIPYEVPENPDIELKTDKHTIEECVQQILDKVDRW